MDNIKLYKKITLEIIQCLKDDKIEELEILFEKREKILQEEKNNKNFKDLMINIGIIDLDKTIKNLLNQNMIKIKLEIQKQKLSTITNNTYINNNQQKINIFSIFLSSMEKTASTTACSSPWRTISLLALPPRENPSASMIRDFPAPVSPVRIFKPFPKTTSDSCIRATFLMLIYSSINYAPYQLCIIR